MLGVNQKLRSHFAGRSGFGQRRDIKFCRQISVWSLQPAARGLI
jgi:hypothetical protein